MEISRDYGHIPSILHVTLIHHKVISVGFHASVKRNLHDRKKRGNLVSDLRMPIDTFFLSEQTLVYLSGCRTRDENDWIKHVLVSSETMLRNILMACSRRLLNYQMEMVGKHFAAIISFFFSFGHRSVITLKCNDEKRKPNWAGLWKWRVM